MSVPQRTIQTGCCGFSLAQAKYVQTFSCVEIATSFYNLPKLETAARWKASAPAGFQFALKAWQAITHRASSPTYKRTRIPASDLEHCGHFGFNPTIRWAWDETFAVAKELDAVLVLFQCAASFRPNPNNLAALRKFFERAKRGRFQMGWEPRGEWDAELVAELCAELDLIHVVDPFQTRLARPGKTQYFRLHGIGGARHRYTDEELQRLRGFCAEGKKTYCMFNNIAMAADAQRFMRLVTPVRQTPPP
jgi:uncharacterized protein YecE (DUF72 family)